MGRTLGDLMLAYLAEYDGLRLAGHLVHGSHCVSHLMVLRCKSRAGISI